MKNATQAKNPLKAGKKLWPRWIKPILPAMPTRLQNKSGNAYNLTVAGKYLAIRSS
jgi:hypothetical protein